MHRRYPRPCPACGAAEQVVTPPARLSSHSLPTHASLSCTLAPNTTCCAHRLGQTAAAPPSCCTARGGLQTLVGTPPGWPWRADAAPAGRALHRISVGGAVSTPTLLNRPRTTTSCGPRHGHHCCTMLRIRPIRPSPRPPVSVLSLSNTQPRKPAAARAPQSTHRMSGTARCGSASGWSLCQGDAAGPGGAQHFGGGQQPGVEWYISQGTRNCLVYSWQQLGEQAWHGLCHTATPVPPLLRAHQGHSSKQGDARTVEGLPQPLHDGAFLHGAAGRQAARHWQCCWTRKCCSSSRRQRRRRRQHTCAASAAGCCMLRTASRRLPIGAALGRAWKLQRIGGRTAWQPQGVAGLNLQQSVL